MKYLVLIPDGMADYPIEALGGKTPLEVAYTPNLDLLAQKGFLGLVKTIPDGFPPGSDVANLSIFGYNPRVYYTGRAPFEAASRGIPLEEKDVAFRCNLVTISEDGGVPRMLDFSAGHISTEEAREIIKDMDRLLGSKEIRFYPGISYRHLMIWKNGKGQMELTPPHDISGKGISLHLPQGEGSERVMQLMEAAKKILNGHPVNRERIKKRLKPANSIWFWGQGKATLLPSFEELYALKGAVISAVDLVKGIGIRAKLKIVQVPGATGFIDTNYLGKAEYALRELEEGDFIYVHLEAPDEASHNGDLSAKIEAIENFDGKILGTLLKNLSGNFRIMVLPDHPTPLSLKTHTIDPVPFLICSSEALKNKCIQKRSFDEKNAKQSSFFLEEGHRLMSIFLQRGVR